MRENRLAWERVWFRPRILISVSKIDYSSTILGFPVDIPLMIAPTALAKLATPDGEVSKIL
jgi:isopentenyl diphosphate isomerase/L-lactate dehydrogenase-like FMN-dependent dehydrogenase